MSILRFVLTRGLPLCVSLVAALPCHSAPRKVKPQTVSPSSKPVSRASQPQPRRAVTQSTAKPAVKSPIAAKAAVARPRPVAVPPVQTLAVAAPFAWQPMPLLPPEAKLAGVFPGGEGGQWPRWSPAVSEADPDFLILPIDVGGLYRTLDGGQKWEPAMQNWNARGANGFAIDPRNANRVIGIGGNSLDWNMDWGQSPHGLYLSSDKAASWKQVLAVPDGLAGLVAYDPTSFDAQLGFCRVAYYSAPLSGLFRTRDGGASWQRVSQLASQEAHGPNIAARIAVHPQSGALYVGGKTGLHRSLDGGAHFEKIYDGGAVWGVSLSRSNPNRVWISGTGGVLASDKGGAFVALPARGIARAGGEAVQQITVSPANANRMFVWVAGANWNWVRYISHDGGQSFEPVKIERGIPTREASVNTREGGVAPLPYNVRNGHFTWHPTDPDIAWGLGGDWVTKSSDGGRNFRWSNNGYNGIMVGSSFNFSLHEPNTVFLAFQDYNGAFTLDGGQTWNYRDVSGHGWGGHCYGGHAVDKEVMWYGDSQGWASPRRTRISRDGGQTWQLARDKEGKECIWSSAEISYSDPKNRNILFASNWRSTDKGATWTRMDACDGVYISAPLPDGRLFGRKNNALVQSVDGGQSWQVVIDVPDGFRDVAFDHKRGKFYFVSQERLKTWQNGEFTTLETPRDQYGNIRLETVAVDPVVPEVVYTGGPRNIYASAATIARSLDAGATWANLTTGHGAHKVGIVRVHPVTREAWISGQCYGMWRIAPPQTLGAAPVALANAPRAEPVPVAEALVAQTSGDP